MSDRTDDPLIGKSEEAEVDAHRAARAALLDTCSAASVSFTSRSSGTPASSRRGPSDPCPAPISWLMAISSWSAAG